MDNYRGLFGIRRMDGRLNTQKRVVWSDEGVDERIEKLFSEALAILKE